MNASSEHVCDCETSSTTDAGRAWRQVRRGASDLACACGCAVRRLVGPDGAERGSGSPALAAVLSLLLPGLGQAYNGQVLKGALFLVACWLVIPWALAVMDAYYVARINNLELGLQG